MGERVWKGMLARPVKEGKRRSLKESESQKARMASAEGKEKERGRGKGRGERRGGEE